MKESTLIEIQRNVETAGRVMNQIVGEMKMLDERIHGIYMFLQQLPNYEEILEDLKKQQEEASKKELDIDGQK